MQLSFSKSHAPTGQVWPEAVWSYLYSLNGQVGLETIS